ncbi:MAG: thiamine-phosphate kinase [Acidimicrobiales bacterium]
MPLPSEGSGDDSRGGSGDESGADEFAVLARMSARLADPRRYRGLRRALPGETFTGDDAAVLVPPEGRLLLTTDLLVEGVHFDLALGSLEDAAWKAIAVNVSDIAAMGGEPRHAVVGLAAPGGTDLDAVMGGLAEAAAAYRIGLVGGDLTRGERLVFAVTVTGSCAAGGEVLRSGAKAGDEVWVTGPLGASAAGLEALQAAAPLGDTAGGDRRSVAAELALAYRRPVARVAEGRLAASLGARGMIDVSDGLARDLDHIATGSGVGVRLDSVPIAGGASLEHALGGGEDYELVFCTEPGTEVVAAFASAGLRPPVRMGVCASVTSAQPGCSLGGLPLRIVGWSHSFG